MLEVKNITKRWSDGNVALDNVSFSTNPGELVALIGPSGSGKSTILRVIAKLESYESGNINCTYNKIGMVFQQPSMWPHLTLMDNVTLPLWSIMGVDKNRAKEIAKEILIAWGLEHRLNAYPYELSGGEQQRGALARTLVMEPEVLCLDEITSALDPEITADILIRLLDVKKKNAIILLATHHLGFAKKSADRVLFLEKGRIIEQGTPYDVLENSKNSRTQRFVEAGNLS